MGKSVLVMDTPENCSKCDLKDGYFCGRTKRWIDEDCFPKPDWCPLKDIPEKADHPDYCDNGRYDKGWNDCIDEILKGGEAE